MSTHVTPTSVSALTEPEYLKVRTAHDPLRGWLANLCAIVALVIEHASNALPTMFDENPNRACFAWLSVYRFTESEDADHLGARTYRNMLDRLGVVEHGGVLTVDEWASAPLIADALDGQVLDGGATSPAPRVLTTTVGHRAGNDGTFTTYRAHMPVIDSLGNLGDAHTLVRDANAILAVSIHPAGDTSWHMEGTQDKVHNPDHDHAARGTQGRVKLKVSRPAATYRRGARVVVVDSEGTAVVTTRCEIRYNRAKLIGHGHWVQVATRVANQPTTVKARRAKAATKPEPITVDASSAPDVAAQVAMEMWNTRSGHTANATTHAPTQRRVIVTTSGVKVTVGLSGKGYDVVIVPSAGKRVRTTTSAPEYVEAIVRNRLAILG